MPRRILDHRRRGGRRAHPQNRANSSADRGASAPPTPVVPKEDFDFDRANSKFDKASIYAYAAATTDASNVDSLVGTAARTSEPEKMASPEPGEIVPSPQVKEPKKFYDKSKSFFDDISSDAKSKADGGASGGRNSGGGRGRGGGGRGGRNRRDEERTKNLTTFGETGTGGSGYGPWQGGANGGANSNPGWRGGRRRRPNNANHGQVRQNCAVRRGRRGLIYCVPAAPTSSCSTDCGIMRAVNKMKFSAQIQCWCFSVAFLVLTLSCAPKKDNFLWSRRVEHVSGLLIYLLCVNVVEAIFGFELNHQGGTSTQRWCGWQPRASTAQIVVARHPCLKAHGSKLLQCLSLSPFSHHGERKIL